MSDRALKELRDIATFLGISVENKTAEDLGTLIKEATTKKPPLQSPNAIHNVLSKDFEEGRFTDCTIRVKINGRPEKRLKSESGEAAVDVRGIKAHALVLSSRSAYFDKAMGGEWRESQDRSFEVEVADEEEYVTFRRLIKLCYGSTFAKEAGRDLDSSELVRLIHVANAFECMDAVKECAVALAIEDLDWEGAVQCLELTEMLKGVEGMADVAKRAGNAIAKEVGPVHELFVPSKEERGPGVLAGLKLPDRVKDLSPTVFEALLCSSGLQLQTESETFWLLYAWVESQSDESEEGKQELFTRMAKGLRFHAMDPGYILVVVSKHPRIIAAGLQAHVLIESLAHSNLARRTIDEVRKFTMATEDIDPEPSTLCDRKGKWTFNASFSAAETATLSAGRARVKVVGLAAGLPWLIGLQRGRELNVQAITGCKHRFRKTCGTHTRAGFYFHYMIEVGVDTPRETSGAGRKWSRRFGWASTFTGWDDVFREGSEWLVDGELHVRVTVEIVNDQRPSLSTDAIASLEAESAEEESEDEEA